MQTLWPPDFRALLIQHGIESMVFLILGWALKKTMQAAIKSAVAEVRVFLKPQIEEAVMPIRDQMRAHVDEFHAHVEEDRAGFAALRTDISAIAAR